MGKHTVHKLFVIVIALAMFSFPFYLQRSHLMSTASSNAYTIGAVLPRSTPAPEPAPIDPTVGSLAAMAETAGQNFVGTQAHVAPATPATHSAH